MKKYFFGWTNIRFGIKSLISIWSDKDSFFSKKRIESNVAFLGGYVMLLHHYWTIRTTISTIETVEIAAILFGICGYNIKKIQDEKNNKIEQFPKDEQNGNNNN